MQPIPYNAQIDPAVIHRGPPTKAAPGFTLIELIAVIALITLMLGFATLGGQFIGRSDEKSLALAAADHSGTKNEGCQ